MDKAYAFCRLRRASVVLVILACAFAHVHGARKLHQDLHKVEDIMQGGEFFDAQSESHMKAIESALAALTAEDSDTLHRVLLEGAAAYPPSQPPSPPTPSPSSSPPAPSPPPPLPPGLAIEIGEYSAKFVNSSLSRGLDPTDKESLEAFVGGFKNITADFFGISPNNIIVRGVYKGGQQLTRRMMLARSERTWTHRQLATALPANSNMRLLIHVRSYVADGATVGALRQAERDLMQSVPSIPAAAATVYTAPLAPLNRAMAETSNDNSVVIVEFTVVQYVEVVLPPSPPPSPPLSPGEIAPPNVPPSPPQRPTHPPPRPPFSFERLADSLGALKPPSLPLTPPPQLPSSPQPPSPKPPSPPSPPSPSPPPPAPSPPPPLPPGLAIEVAEYNAKFVNSSLSGDLDLTDKKSLEAFVGDFKNITADFFGISPDNIIVRGVYKGGQQLTRRMMLARSERTWTHRQLATALPANSNMRLLIHVRSYVADGATVGALRQAERDLMQSVPNAGTVRTRPVYEVSSTAAGRMAQTNSDGGVVIVEFTIVQYIEVSLPPSPPPSPPLSPDEIAPPNAPQSPPQRPTHPPPRPPFSLKPPLQPRTITSINVTEMWGQGSIVSPSKRTDDGDLEPGTVVWSDDPIFRTYRKPRSALNLVFASKHMTCAVMRGVCAPCPRAWEATKTFRTVPIYFRQPVQIDTIKILQLQNPGVVSVELLPWPATAIPELPSLQSRNGTLGAPVWKVEEDSSECGMDLVIQVSPEVSGMNIAVPPRGSQESLPPRFRSSAAGGLLITVKEQRRTERPTVIESGGSNPTAVTNDRYENVSNPIGLHGSWDDNLLAAGVRGSGARKGPFKERTAGSTQTAAADCSSARLQAHLKPECSGSAGTGSASRAVSARPNSYWPGSVEEALTLVVTVSFNGESGRLERCRTGLAWCER
ncbi:hypothetical protein VOLCADRAFT_89040 [Volvox carteri f. nagariensis]|uniref:Uncharacterized protein n=1 Tax=Volvox carteri f. nagariensis TaxID=3068 RepID=D8TQM6_VOLCA|nr:uncharacterized protein VOLCADRAFT_89040 [Volvox carteri f. nagariensis]EFJ50178.1 hypothetical protein VOLCADRAFT_89040 [Volvox carteri f. nagariensis]|eukprot:XP_002948798.1 hypothetical protein VOLCADRAFT_89040 [Volvox carteri f. nagariensis]